MNVQRLYQEQADIQDAAIDYLVRIRVIHDVFFEEALDKQRSGCVNVGSSVENMLSNPLAIAALGRWNCHNRRYHSVVIGDV
jgi:hypothetical protein